MSIFCKELNKEFATKSEMFAALKANKDKIIGLKKAAIKDSDGICYSIKSKEVEKAADTTQTIGPGSRIFAVINCTNWLDSHGDVHLDGIWDLSIKDNKGKLFYTSEHELKLGKIISWPDEVDPFVQQMDWSDLGQDYTGKTQALIFDVLLTDASNEDALKAISGKKPIQNSVRMQYIEMQLCIDDKGDDFKQEYANFYKYLALIANKDDAMEAGYFWAIGQAKIVKEGSAVLYGSNPITPILYSDPGSTSQNNNKNEPAGEQLTKRSLFHNLI